jgi:hypothetical protein
MVNEWNNSGDKKFSTSMQSKEILSHKSNLQTDAISVTKVTPANTASDSQPCICRLLPSIRHRSRSSVQLALKMSSVWFAIDIELVVRGLECLLQLPRFNCTNCLSYTMISPFIGSLTISLPNYLYLQWKIRLTFLLHNWAKVLKRKKNLYKICFYYVFGDGCIWSQSGSQNSEILKSHIYYIQID